MFDCDTQRNSATATWVSCSVFSDLKRSFQFQIHHRMWALSKDELLVVINTRTLEEM